MANDEERADAFGVPDDEDDAVSEDQLELEAALASGAYNAADLGDDEHNREEGERAPKTAG